MAEYVKSGSNGIGVYKETRKDVVYTLYIGNWCWDRFG